ncbi:hypothetical protein AK812_SmicGene43756 [Symbiodinium microadriaticum]|uniref:Reverse transcriptase domain-containing protein n=1 Tax=Symbiodinium microadriaticum TaxID=2951 RepID=A0A1Q9C084_SYMMI|nr:hypothetical protein AK812_SmicGene43756 [Symbiodinium microadriaticum]
MGVCSYPSPTSYKQLGPRSLLHTHFNGQVHLAQPRSLQIREIGDAGEEAIVLCPLRGKDAMDVLVSAERRAENEKALAIAWERPIPCPDGFLAVAAQAGDACRLLSSCVPNAGLATVELNARMLAKCRMRSGVARRRTKRKRWSATEIDPRATVLSIDAIGAFDHVSRHAMLAGLRQRPGLQPLLPYVRQFYAPDSTYVWQDADWQSHEAVLKGHAGGLQLRRILLRECASD